MAPPSSILRDPPGITLVFLGGVVGTTARLSLEQLHPVTSGGWPTTTFLVNIVGALVLGALLEYLAATRHDEEWGRRVRLFGGTGICGGFTTYSTFATEQVTLIHDGHLPLALTYGVATVVLGGIATVTGLVIGARLASRGTIVDPGVIDPDGPQ